MRYFVQLMFFCLCLFGCGEMVPFDDTADSGVTVDDIEELDVGDLEKTAGNGFTYPISTLTAWTDGNYGACGSSYISGYCHTGTDLIYSRGTSVYSLAAGKVVAVSGSQNASCTSGWGYDWNGSSGTATCNMAVAIQYYDDDGTPFVVVLGHLQYNSSITTSTLFTPGQVVGQVAYYYDRLSGKPISSDHLHFGIFPGTSSPTSWGRMACSISQTARTSLPTGCSSGGATASGTYLNAAGRNWVAPPYAPALTTPYNGSFETSPVTLRWANGSGAYRAHIMVCNNSALTSGCFNPDGAMTGAEPTGTGAYLSTTYNATLSPGTYYWAVRDIAYNDYGGWGGYSSVRWFTVW